jgi:hypothetical protein
MLKNFLTGKPMPKLTAATVRLSPAISKNLLEKESSLATEI